MFMKMIEFQCCFDTKRDILTYLQTNRTQDDDAPDLTVRVLTQEKDGCILYSWQDVTDPLIEDSPVVTQIGLYDPAKESHEKVFVHDSDVEVTCCSINQERTFLGFVTVECESVSDASGTKKSRQDVYKAFLAEIQPQSRVFDLNIQRNNYLKLQFLYGKYKGHAGSRESHMLVLLHKESIGLYHIPVARMGDSVIMSNQPRTEQLIKKFIWSQWSTKNQRLYVAHFKKQGKATELVASQPQPVLTCYQFLTSVASEYVLEVDLDLPLPNLKFSTRSSYLDIELSNSIPDSSINMEMISYSAGTFCLCFQHPSLAPQETNSKARRMSRSLSVGSEPLTATLNYSICMLHHGKTLNCAVPNIPKAIVDQSRLHFSKYGDYVMVYLPGHFLHLLNVGIEQEPCHHIFLHDVPALPQDSSLGASPLTPHLSHFHRDRSSDLHLYDSSSGKAYKVSLDRDRLVEIFQTSQMMTKLAILHFAVVHDRDITFIRKLFEIICQDPVNPEVPYLLEEFLVGSTYSAMKRQLGRDIMRLIHFTTTDTFRGQFEKKSDGERLAQVSYTPLKKLALNVAIKRDWQKLEDVWENLTKHIQRCRVEQVTRFCNKTVHKEFIESGSMKKQKLTEKKSFLSKLTGLTREKFSSSVRSNGKTERPPSRTELILGKAPAFLKDTQASKDLETLDSFNIEKLSHHLMRYLRKESKEKINNIAKEYVSFQLQQSRVLCHLIWSILGCEDEDFSSTSLCDEGNTDDCVLFYMFERYWLATTHLAFPLPPGFSTFFTALGYRCLEFRIFLQYVNNGVLQLTPEFINQILADLDDEDEENVAIKYEIICKLPHDLALQTLQRWEYVGTRRFHAHKHVASILCDDNPQNAEPFSKSEQGRVQCFQESSPGGATEGAELPEAVFPPLANLIKLVQYKGVKSSQAGCTVDSQYLRDAALVFTRAEYNQDLKNVNF